MKRTCLCPLILLSMTGLLMVAASYRAAGQQAEMTYIYNAPESATDVRYTYQWEILRTALEKTREKYGPYRMIMSQSMTERRQVYEMMQASGTLTVMYLSTKPELERNLIAVHIPVDKNLGGYCVFLIRKDQKEEFQKVKTLNDLKKFKYGMGLDWIDVDILRQNGFHVITGSSYDGLFEMLVNKRFDVFIRAAVEVLDEVEQRRIDLPDLFIEETICFNYTMPMYFWFTKNEQGSRLAARAEEGMRKMIADGSYDKIFDKYQQAKIEALRLRERKMFYIKNQFLGPETPVQDRRLWFDPGNYQPKKRVNHD